MSKNICSCEKCCAHEVTDPVTGLVVKGCLLGKNELIEHRRLARIKQRFSVGMADSDASIPLGSGSNSQSHPPIPKSEPNCESTPPLKDIGQLSQEGMVYSYYL
jgi:hypothetical protein